MTDGTNCQHPGCTRSAYHSCDGSHSFLIFSFKGCGKAMCDQHTYNAHMIINGSPLYSCMDDKCIESAKSLKSGIPCMFCCMCCCFCVLWIGLVVFILTRPAKYCFLDMYGTMKITTMSENNKFWTETFNGRLLRSSSRTEHRNVC